MEKVTLERNNVYNTDCIEGIKQMLNQNMRVDCVITDPPFLINYETRFYKTRNKRYKAILNDDNPEIITQVMPLLYDVMKDNTALYMFCGCQKIDFFLQEVQKYFNFKNIIVWDKINHSCGDLYAAYGRQYEFIIYANKGRAMFKENLHRLNDIWQFLIVPNLQKLHQNQKPIPLLSRMITYHTNENDLIFDPFCGSNSTCVAAYRLQRDYIGFELDREKYDIGEKRMQAEKAKISIFDLQEVQQ